MNCLGTIVYPGTTAAAAFMHSSKSQKHFSRVRKKAPDPQQYLQYVLTLQVIISAFWATIFSQIFRLTDIKETKEVSLEQQDLSERQPHYSSLDKHKILILEHYEGWKKLLQIWFQDTDYIPVLSQNVEEAWRILSSEKIELTIINLGDEPESKYEGEALLHLMKEQGIPLLPSIVLSCGDPDKELVGLRQRYPINKIFQKGDKFTKIQFLQAVEECF